MTPSGRRFVDPTSSLLRERAHVVLDAVMSAYALYETGSRAAGADDDDAFLAYRALDEVVAALRCALGRYVAHGDDPAAGLRGYVHDEDLDEVVFRRRIEEEAKLLERLAIR